MYGTETISAQFTLSFLLGIFNEDSAFVNVHKLGEDVFK
jgi:hypothetical protein